MNYETVLAGEVSGAEKGIFALSASQALSPPPLCLPPSLPLPNLPLQSA